MARVAAAGIDWGDNRVMQGAVIALLLMAAVPGLAEAECAPRTEKLCVLVNDPGPIIQGTIVEGTDSSGYQWVVRVDRSFRGDLKGQVVVWVTYGDGSGPARFLKPGEQYLFYLQPSLADGSPGLSAVLGCGSSVALQHAQKGEVAFLARLGSRVADGRILGQVSRSRPHPDEDLPYARVRVTATSAGRTFVARTKSDGSFEIAGLPPGDYHLDADLPGHELAEVEDPVELQPHGCAESDIDVQDNTRVRGHITLAAGTLSDRLRSVVAFTPDGRGVGRGSVDDRGDYEIHGIPPGDYVIGTPREDLFPRPDAPYRQTYAPGTNDLALARRVHVAIGAPVTNVDLTISSVMPTRDVVVRPRAGDRRIAPSSFTVLMRNGNQAIWGDLVPTSSSDGAFVLTIVAGPETYVTGQSETLCAIPVLLTTETAGAPVTLQYSEDGCRQVGNLKNMLSLQEIGGPFVTLPVHVSLAGGRPAAGAMIAVVSSGPSRFASALFTVDGDGRLDLRVPLNERFTVSASWHDGPAPCNVDKQLVNTSDPVSGPLELVLSGAGCRSR